MSEEFGDDLDLFGQRQRLVRRGRGRPSHEATKENRDKVMLWLVTGRTDEEIAEALGITTRTLSKHYFHELSYRRTARMQMEAVNLGAIVEQVRDGNTSAMSLLDKKLERLYLRDVKNFQAQTAAPKLGKKESQRIAATQPKGGWAALLPGGQPETLQ